MTLPHPRLDGTLPPGQHSIADLNAQFVAFPAVTPRRQSRIEALAQFVEVVSRLALGTQILVDGSYVTGKADPADIDLAVLSTGMNETDMLQQLQQEGVGLTLLDIFVETTQTGFANWISFFSADRSGHTRGVVLLAI